MSGKPKLAHRKFDALGPPNEYRVAKMANYLAELKQRSICRVGAAYVVVAWILLQLANIRPRAQDRVLQGLRRQIRPRRLLAREGLARLCRYRAQRIPCAIEATR